MNCSSKKYNSFKKEKKRFLQKIEQEFQFKLAKQNFDYFAKNPLLFYQTLVKS